MENKNEQKKSMQFLFMDINRCCAANYMKQVAMQGLYPNQIPFIMVLDKNDGCSQREIAERLRIKPPTVNVSIQRLEKSGIVFRMRDKKDQRIMRVNLTEKGKAIVKSIRENAREMEKIMFDNFDDTELCLMRRFLEQILQNIGRKPGMCLAHLEELQQDMEKEESGE